MRSISAKYLAGVDQVDQVDQAVLGHPISLVNFSGGMHVAGTASHGLREVLGKPRHDAGASWPRARRLREVS